MNKGTLINIAFWTWLLTVIILSVIPKTPDVKFSGWGLEFRLDYAEHFVVYLVLGMLFIKKRKTLKRSGYTAGIFYYTIWILFAALAELVQKYIPGRSFNPNDMYYNIGGIMAGLSITGFYFRKAEETTKNENMNH
ncbi:MAG: VanZ family protein [Bacteroidales bacterium]|nr:VanZ family protein [Bacteroidales bacterium]